MKKDWHCLTARTWDPALYDHLSGFPDSTPATPGHWDGTQNVLCFSYAFPFVRRAEYTWLSEPQGLI